METVRQMHETLRRDLVAFADLVICYKKARERKV